MAGKKGPADPVAAASALATPRKTTKARAAQFAEASGSPPPPTLPSTGGRPSVMTEAICDEILNRISLGESLMDICEFSPHLPERSTVQRYVERDASFAAAYSRARVEWARAQGDVILRIADDSDRDWEEKTTFGGKTELRPNREVVDRSKLRIATRQWLMERYGKTLFSQDATKLNPNDSGAAEDIKKDATVIAPDEPGPDKPVL